MDGTALNREIFTVGPEHAGRQPSAAMQYWESVVSLCDESNLIYPADEGGRDVFALGNVIVKSSHLHDEGEIDCSFADSNEVEAISIAKDILADIRVPELYFSDKVFALLMLYTDTTSDTWPPPSADSRKTSGCCPVCCMPYLSQRQKQSFKEQAQEVLRQLHTFKPRDGRRVRSHVVQDPRIRTNGQINPLEEEIMFSDTNTDPDLSFMHNDFTQSNCIVDNDKIVGLVNWEMAGFFGWKEAGEVHRNIRTPQREHFVNVSLSEERLRDIMFWNAL